MWYHVLQLNVCPMVPPTEIIADIVKHVDNKELEKSVYVHIIADKTNCVGLGLLVGLGLHNWTMTTRDY